MLIGISQSDVGEAEVKLIVASTSEIEVELSIAEEEEDVSGFNLLLYSRHCFLRAKRLVAGSIPLCLKAFASVLRVRDCYPKNYVTRRLHYYGIKLYLLKKEKTRCFHANILR